MAAVGADDRQILAMTLQSDLSDLSYEIANTDTQDFRDRLKQKRDVLSRTLEALKAGSPAV